MAFALPACAMDTAGASNVMAIADIDDLYARLGEPSRMEILADGRSVLTWESARNAPLPDPAQEFSTEPVQGCFLRVVIAADNTIDDQRIHSAPGAVQCEYFDALNTPRE
jgi:hypothetical protein